MIREPGQAAEAPIGPAFHEVGVDQAKRDVVVALRHEVSPEAFDPTRAASFAAPESVEIAPSTDAQKSKR